MIRNGTERLPMTPAMRGLVGANDARGYPIYLVLAGLWAALMIGAGFVFQDHWDVIGILIALISGGLVFAYLKIRGSARADLRQGVFLRLTGSISVERIVDSDDSPGSSDRRILRIGSASVNLPDYIANQAPVGGSIDMLPHSQLILEMRDESGRIVYRAAGYNPK